MNTCQQVRIFDTTLRDWDQWTGTPFTRKEKMIVAQILHKAGIDIIEAGFARSRCDSDSIKAVVKEIWKESNSPIITSLSRANIQDIDSSCEALIDATRPRIHTFIATSEDHLANKLGITRTQAIDKIISSVSHATKSWMEVQWSAEDATNSDREFLLEAVIAAIENGATIINIPDTLWWSDPWTIESLFLFLKQCTEYLRKEWKDFIFSAHGHNDNWLALAGSIWALRWWATQIETTILWIWERTWNTKFHELLAYINEKWDGNIVNWINFVHNCRIDLVYPVSFLVSRIIWMNIHPNEPIIWSRTNSHGSWIHMDWAIKWNKSTWHDPYTIINTAKYSNPWEIKTFNARWGAAEVTQMLELFWINVENKSSLDIIVTKCSSEAEKARWIYPTMIYWYYLEEQGQFRIDNIQIIDQKEVRIKLTINWKPIELIWKAVDENWIIDATVNAINNYLWDDIITIDSYHAEDRESPAALAKEFWLNYTNWWQGKDMWSEKIWIVTFCLKTQDGKKLMTRHASNNMDESAIKAIIYGSLEYLSGKS